MGKPPQMVGGCPGTALAGASAPGAGTGGSKTTSKLRRTLPFPCNFDSSAFQHRRQISYSWRSISLGEHFLIFPQSTHLPTLIVNLLETTGHCSCSPLPPRES